MATEDITRLTFSDRNFDFVWCSHVLEHVPDDQIAMRELRRVLTDDGLCVVQVPIWRRTTYEDPAIVAPEARLEAFGQKDHVRLYGFDIETRLTSAGFGVEQVITRDFDLQTIGHYGLNHVSSSEHYLCSRH